MTNNKALEYMMTLQNKCINGYEAEAINLAIKAIRIVCSIDLSFENSSNLMIDSDDWNDIKAIIDKYDI